MQIHKLLKDMLAILFHITCNTTMVFLRLNETVNVHFTYTYISFLNYYFANEDLHLSVNTIPLKISQFKIFTILTTNPSHRKYVYFLTHLIFYH